MFARVTPYKMKSDSTASARELLHTMKDEIMGMPGMHNFINVMNEDGSGYIVSVVESQATSDANAPKVAELWGRFADHLEAMPQPTGFDVVCNWSN